METTDTTARPIPMSPRLILGVFIMGFGLLLTLDNLGLIDSGRWWRFWPLILIVAGAARLREVSWRVQADKAGGLLVAVGSVLLLANMGLFRLRYLWPLFLLGLGGSLIWKAVRTKPGERTDTPSLEGADRIEAFVMIGGVSRRSHSQDFKGGSATAVMGGAEVDFRHASITTSPVVFDTFTMWGGISLKVPRDWVVESQVLPVLGGFEDKTHPEPGSHKRLIITGMAIMGGIEVKN
jgi:hypothetical protein